MDQRACPYARWLASQSAQRGRAAEYVRPANRRYPHQRGTWGISPLRCERFDSTRETKLGTKAELKNINSFKNVNAIEHEIRRQIDLTLRGEAVVQETSWDAERGTSKSMRSRKKTTTTGTSPADPPPGCGRGLACRRRIGASHPRPLTG